MAQAPEKASDKAQDTSPQTWDSFVAPGVKFKADPDTRKLIEAIMPCFPRPCKVIAGYLNDDDQFWKVNYHWELLSTMVGRALGLSVSAASLTTLKSISIDLEGNKPDPAKGYMASKKPGEPHDRSTSETIVERWKLLKTSKAAFRKVLDSEEIPKKHPPSERWDLAAAPVAMPGTSKHGSGYALDIHGAGKNKLISEISRSLGASLVFDEKSHVHVEFKQGVVIGKPLIADDKHNGKYSGWMHSEKALPEEWHVYSGDRSYGPYKLPQMKQLLQEGRLIASSLVARIGAKSWCKLSDDNSLKPLIPNAVPQQSSPQPQPGR